MTSQTSADLASHALAVLTTADPAEKVALTRAAAARWDGVTLGRATPPDRPARPASPALLPPARMPRRSTGPKNLPALVHALAHIELNAIDLAWDIIIRYPEVGFPAAFAADWLQVAVDEALHYEMLADWLVAHETPYGALPAHDGLWGAAETTGKDALARLAVVPMTHEARGLDTTPATLERMRANGIDPTLVAALETIYHDEIRHVAAGVRWFSWLTEKEGLDPAATFAARLEAYYPGGLKRPFNHAARAEAGFPQAWYEGAARD